MSVGYSFAGNCYDSKEAVGVAMNLAMPQATARHISSGTWATGRSIWNVNMSGKDLLTGVSSGPQVVNIPIGYHQCTVGSPVTWQDLLTVPSLADAASAWSVGFLTPMLVAFIAWGVGSLLSVVRGAR